MVSNFPSLEWVSSMIETPQRLKLALSSGLIFFIIWNYKYIYIYKYLDSHQQELCVNGDSQYTV